MSNPIYKAQARPYTENINDLVEKGGPGSGKKGHKTVKPVNPPREHMISQLHEWHSEAEDHNPNFDHEGHRRKLEQMHPDKLAERYHQTREYLEGDYYDNKPKKS